jgi:Protein of unknown function (DUF2420)
MTSFAVHLHHSGTELSFSGDEDVSMAEMYSQLENGVDETDLYEIASTVVEPPQSDAVRTHAPSTIVDELEYDEDIIEYEESDPGEAEAKIPDIIHLAHELHSDSYKVMTRQSLGANTQDGEVHAPPLQESSHNITHQISSPIPRMITIPPRSGTPLPHPEEEVQVDDDWPVCLYTAAGQEYILFRSDGDTEAVFEDNWLKSQPLESLFNSIRQTLETELSSLTDSFTMDEMVFSIPDLDVSIAEVTPAFDSVDGRIIAIPGILHFKTWLT